MSKFVSIIIPAYNEEKGIKGIISDYKSQDYPNKEIIVVVNNTTDRTFEIAQKYADKALNFKEKIGVCAGRNEGVKIAKGDIFVFTDADSRLSKGAVRIISEAIKENTFGSTLGRGDNNSFKGKLFFFYKNWTHRLGIYKGVVDGVFFCHRDIFLKAGGFDKNLKIGEFQDIIKRMNRAGGKYRLLKDCYAVVSLRRYEEEGYLKTHFFWIRWKIANIFKKDKKIANSYFD